MKRGCTIKNVTGAILKLLFTVCIITASTLVSKAQFQPWHYFTFDGTSPLKDSLTSTALNPTYFQSTYSIANEGVGKSLSLGAGGKAIIVSNSFPIDSVITLEFLFKPSHDFALTTFITRRDGAVYIKMGYPFIQFITNAQSSTGANIHHEQYIELEGVGRGSFSYYVDGNWHQMVFKYNPRTGVKEIWIDGQLPSGFNATTTAGARFNPNTANTANNIFDMSSVTSYDKINGNLDEIAMYNIDLPGAQIYKHYTEFKQNKHFSFGATSLTVPTASPVTASVDINDYAPGHPTPTVNAVEQLKAFPTPRYKKGHTLLPNFDWIGMEYFGSAYQPGVTNAQAVTNTVAIQSELAKNFNYSILVASNTNTTSQYSSPSQFQGAWVQLANQNPQWKTGAICFWAQLNPQVAGFSSNTGYISNKNLPAQHYLRNSSGQYLDINGGTSSNKFWSPAAPVDSFYKDGLTQKFLMSKLLSSLTRPLDLLCENGEVIPKPITSVMQSDPAVVADKATTSYDWDTYLGNRKYRVSTAYRDQFMGLSGLQNTIYSEYQISGSTSRIKYSEARKINKPINGQIYATPDFYPRWSSNWFTGVSAWNGWKHIIEGRFYELQQSDKLYSPFVAAGWDLNEEVNIRPGQWLGLMKVLGMTGAEFYYTGYFNEAGSYNAPNPPPANPAGYAWQAVIPSYAQATTSRYEDILRNGSLMPGDVPYSVGTPNQPGYSFNTGDQRKLVVVRKHDSKELYAITGTIQPNSNMIGNAEVEGDAMIKLNGQDLQFNVRRQGSTYIYDNTNSAAPVFYQLDGWHESTHPYRWSKDFNFEAELFDVAAPLAVIKTQRAANASSTTDFRNSTSYVTHANGATTFATLQYNFTPRAGGSNYYFWIRARSRAGIAGGINVSVNGQNQKSVGCISDTTWNWYSVDACSGQAIKFLALSTQDYTLMITPNSANIEIDRVLLSIDPALNLNTNQAACGTSVAAITPSGPTSFCQGNNVTLTAQTGTAYLWSGGQTTQAITVNASGNYAVTVNNGTGCSSISAPVAVTVSTITPATITASGSTTLCSGQTATLNASAGSSFKWSNGATTQTINTNVAGSYIVTVTNSSGCTSVSAALPVTVSNGTPATITASGSTSLCPGQTVTFTSSGGSSYAWSNGATTQNITVGTAGNYSVIVNNGSCSSTSAIQAVSVSSTIPVTVSASGSTSFCQGGSLNLSAPAGYSYLWSNGQTAQQISISTSGSYSVKITNSNGCTGVSQATAVSVNPSPVVSINASGSLNFCDGGSVQLNAAGGSSYLWSNGQTTSSLVISQSGTFSVTATNSSGCSATSTAISTNKFAPVNAGISISGPSVLTLGQITKLNASGGASYLWSNGSTSASILITLVGTYSVTATDANGCSAVSAPVTITQNISPSTVAIQSSGPISFCQGNSTNLTASGGQKYLWSPGGATTSTINVLKGGTYRVYSLDNSGQVLAQDSITVQVNALPLIPSITVTYIPNAAYQLTAYEPSGTTYSWSNGQKTQTINVTQPQTVTVLATNAFGCVSPSQSMTINTMNPRSCSKPDMLTAYNISDTSAVLGWNPGITGEIFKVKYWELGSSQTKEVSLDGSLTSKVLPNLIPGTVYNWTVEMICVSGNYLSMVSSFRTLDVALNCGSTPQHLRSVNVRAKSSDLKWYSTIADSYNIRFRPAGNSTWIYRTFTSVAQGGASINSLLPNTTYEWAVKTTCNGYTSPFSTSSFFTTNDTCGYLGQLSIVSSNVNSVDLKWTNVSSMKSVRIKITNTSTGIFRLVVLNANPSTGLYHVSNLSPNTNYTVEVRGVCSTNVFSDWTNQVSFNTSPVISRIEDGNALQLNGFPNPTSDRLGFSFITDKDDDYILKVCDLSGRELVQESRQAVSGENTGEIPVSNFAKGVYLLIVQKGTESSRFRFSVQ